MTDRYAVIGNPVAHSLSPRIHRAFAEETGQDLVYETLQADDFTTVCGGFFRAGGCGLNVTLPFKGDAFDWVGDVDEAALEAAAVNTISPSGSGYRGYNTDGVGLLRDLRDNLKVDVTDRRVLILGAGGAVRGVLGPLCRASPARLTIANRTFAKAVALERKFAQASDGTLRPRAATLDALDDDYHIVINGTSAGVQGLGALVDARVVEGAFCYDMFYSLGTDTPFCRWSRDQGASGVAGGLGMLIEQAAEAFCIWRGVRPTTSGIAVALENG